MSTILSNPITTTTTGILMARIHHAFLTLNPAEVAKVWAQFSRDDKIKLVQYIDGTGLTLFHLILYFTPKNQETSHPYYMTYYPILEWGRHKIPDINRIAGSLCTAKTINPDDTEFYTYSVSPVTLAASRNHMLSFIGLMQSGAELVQHVYLVSRDEFKTTYERIYDTTSCIRSNDPFQVSLLLEIYLINTVKFRFDVGSPQRDMEYEHWNFKDRRRVLKTLIQEAENDILIGQGDVPKKFHCLPFISSPDFWNTHPVTPKTFVSMATQALNQYEQQSQLYRNMFGKDFTI